VVMIDKGRLFGRISVVVVAIYVVAGSTIVVVMGVITVRTVNMGVLVFVIMFAGCAVVVVPVVVVAGFSVLVIVRMMFVITGVAVGMIVGAHSGIAMAVQEIKGTEEKESDSRDERIDSKAGVEVFLNPPTGVEIEEHPSPSHQGQDGERLEKLFHSRLNTIRRFSDHSETEPEVAEGSNDEEKTDCKDQDKARFENGEIHKDQFHIHHRTEDEECEFG